MDTSTPVPPNPQNLVNFVQYLLQNVLTPILQMAGTISFFIGLCLIIAGLTRLYRHGQNLGMFHRIAPMGTAMYFISGVVLISFIPYLSILSNSLFNSNDILMQQCTGGWSPLAPNSFYTNTNSFCPLEAYSTDIQMAPPGEETKTAIKYLAFSALFIVGVISFIRGMVQLVKVGEGHGQGGAGKALTHIFAGLAAVNADNLYALASNILSSAPTG